MKKLRIEKKIVIHNLDNVKKNKDDIIFKLSKFNVSSLYLHFCRSRLLLLSYIIFLKIFKKIKTIYTFVGKT